VKEVKENPRAVHNETWTDGGMATAGEQPQHVKDVINEWLASHKPEAAA
jgi:hypothetical protein